LFCNQRYRVQLPNQDSNLHQLISRVSSADTAIHFSVRDDE
jgi:hypothetical protein